MNSNGASQPVENAARILAILGIALPFLLLIRGLDIGSVTFGTYALLSPLPLHLQMLFSSKRWRELAEIVVVAPLFALAYFSGGTFHHTFNPLAVAVSTLGMASVVVNGGHMLWTQDRKRLPYVKPSIWMLVLTLAVPIGLSLLTTIRQEPAYDAWLYAFDDHLGFQASFMLGRLFLALPALAAVCSVVYLGLPVLVIILYGAQLHFRRLRYTNIFGTSIVGGLMGAALIKVLPAAGPIYAYYTVFPFRPPPIVPGFLHTILLSAPLNSIPSMHSMWAFLMFWGSRKCGLLVRGFVVLILIGTVLATLGFGEHYLVDLVVGLPLAVAADVACLGGWKWYLWKSGRIVVAATLAITIAWLILLRFQLLLGLPSFLCWTLLACTVLISAYLRSSVVGEAERKADERSADTLSSVLITQDAPVASA